MEKLKQKREIYTFKNISSQIFKRELYSAVREGKVLFNTIAKPGMFGLGMALKENFLAYPTEFIFLIIRLVPGNVVMVAIDMSGRSPITR